MQSFIPENNNYSVLNNYNYKDKSKIISTLDWFSTPLRRVLGGKNVYVSIQRADSGYSLSSRIALFVFSILIAPVAVISIISLLIKCATCPCFWEKKKVNDQAEGVKTAILRQNKAIQLADQNFRDAYTKKNYDGALNIALSHPQIMGIKDNLANTVKIIKKKIIDGEPWEILTKHKSLLPKEELISLVDFAISARLFQEHSEKYFTLTTSEITKFVRNLFPAACDIEQCYITLFANALHIHHFDDPLRTAIKMDLADGVVLELTRMKKTLTLDELERGWIQLDETTKVRPQVFTEDKPHMHKTTFFVSEAMIGLRARVNTMRELSQRRHEFLNIKNDALSKNEPETKNKPVQWYKDFSQFIGGLKENKGDELLIERFNKFFEFYQIQASGFENCTPEILKNLDQKKVELESINEKIKHLDRESLSLGSTFMEDLQLAKTNMLGKLIFEISGNTWRDL